MDKKADSCNTFQLYNKNPHNNVQRVPFVWLPHAQMWQKYWKIFSLECYARLTKASRSKNINIKSCSHLFNLLQNFILDRSTHAVKIPYKPLYKIWKNKQMYTLKTIPFPRAHLFLVTKSSFLTFPEKSLQYLAYTLNFFFTAVNSFDNNLKRKCLISMEIKYHIKTRNIFLTLSQFSDYL